MLFYEGMKIWPKHVKFVNARNPDQAAEFVDVRKKKQKASQNHKKKEEEE